MLLKLSQLDKIGDNKRKQSFKGQKRPRQAV